MELLCIETHPDGVVQAGNTYQLVSDKSPCKCNGIDVGIRTISPAKVALCPDCKTIYPNDSIHWVFASRFAPIATEKEVQQQFETVKI